MAVYNSNRKLPITLASFIYLIFAAFPQLVGTGGLQLRMQGPEGEEETEKKCRICLSDANDTDDLLIQPCSCRGFLTWVHEKCLTRWRRTSEKDDAAYRCGQCHDNYRDALTLELLRERLRVQRLAKSSHMPHTINQLASELQDQGKYDEAEPLFRKNLETFRETLGDRHPHTLISIGNLGSLMRDKGDII